MHIESAISPGKATKENTREHPLAAEFSPRGAGCRHWRGACLETGKEFQWLSLCLKCFSWQISYIKIHQSGFQKLIREDKGKINEYHVKIYENSRTINENQWKMNENHTKIEEKHRKNEETHWKMEESHRTIEESHRTIEESHRTIEENHGKFEEYYGTIEDHGKSMKIMEKSMKIMEKSMKTMDNSINTMEQIMKPMGKWWTVRMRDFSYKMQQIRDFTCKNQGREPGRPKKNKKNANLIPRPMIRARVFAVLPCCLVVMTFIYFYKK